MLWRTSVKKIMSTTQTLQKVLLKLFNPQQERLGQLPPDWLELQMNALSKAKRLLFERLASNHDIMS